MFNDLNAPRFNPRKYRLNIVSEESWRKWKNETGRKDSLIQFRAIWNAIALKNIHHVIEERDGVKLGNNMGDIYAGYVKTYPRKGDMDYKTSSILGITFNHENWHSNGKKIKIIYGKKRKYIFKNSFLWGFIPHRNFERRIAAAIRENPENYKNTQEKRYTLNDISSNQDFINKVLRKKRV